MTCQLMDRTGSTKGPELAPSRSPAIVCFAGECVCREHRQLISAVPPVGVLVGGGGAGGVGVVSTPLVY
jgi:hypothetical protein